jgi:precorrin-3B methylase
LSRKGSLVVVGTGITLATHATTEALACMRGAERLFFLVTSPAHALWVRRINPAAISLEDCYAKGKPRRRSYREMTDRILEAVRTGFQTCAVFYGHPGVFAQPSHAAIRGARLEGFAARMLPGISAEDCLFADLGVNPGAEGCQSFEASDFLMARRRFDPTSSLILWQVGLLGELSVRLKMSSRPERLRTLTDTLRRHYPARHPVFLYEAAQFPTCEPIVTRVTLTSLPKQTITPAVTLYLPPLPPRAPDRRIARWFEED